MKKKRYKIVRKWATNKTPDDEVLGICFLLMIPILGQIIFIYSVYSALKNRKVYLEEIK